MPRPFCAVLLPAMLLLACSSPDRPDLPASDTVAVTPDTAAVPTIAIDEGGTVTWQFGGFKASVEDEVQPLGGVMGLVALDGGRYFLTEANRVRVFDRAGAETWRFGRAGSGPQEFDVIGWPCRVQGDTVLFTDQQNQRLAFIAVGSGVVRTELVGGRGVRDGNCTGDGRFLATRFERDTSSQTSTYLLELWTMGDTVGHPIYNQQRPIRSPVGAASPMVGLVDSLVFIADPNTAEIRLVNLDGSFVRSLRWNAERVPVTDENIPERYGAVPARATPAEEQAWWDRVRSRPRAEYWPAFVEVKADAEGRLWVHEVYEREGEVHRWWALTATGEVLARVTIPRATREDIIRPIGFVPGGIAFYLEDDEGAPWLRVISTAAIPGAP